MTRSSLKAQGISVALLGPDGAGKSTLADGIARSCDVPVKYVYMGLWHRAPTRPVLMRLKGLGFARRVLTSWWRYTIGWWYRERGYVVVFDRYTFDAQLPAGPRGWARSRADWLLAHACPCPDLVFVLDAPGDVMFERKREADPEWLETQRAYLSALARRIPNAIAIDATREAECVRREVMQHISQRLSHRQDRSRNR